MATKNRAKKTLSKQVSGKPSTAKTRSQKARNAGAGPSKPCKPEAGSNGSLVGDPSQIPELLIDASDPVSKEAIRVVAIGASAGGLEPIEQLFDEMPIDSRLAFVVIQHLSPDFRSMMDELLARHSTMAIHRIEDGMVIEPNAVYLNSPRQEMTMSGGRFHVKAADETVALALPIDTFMKSLALDRGADSIGVILSGTGSDGTLGGAAIREAGGLVIVQDPDTAKFDSMPRAVLARNIANVAAPAGVIPDIIIRYICGDTVDDVEKVLTPIEGNPEHNILVLLREQYGADFGYYKETTVFRRIRRRAMLRHISDLDDYAVMLASNQSELEALYCDLLIGVTAFFRDRDAFEALEQHVIPKIVERAHASRQIRIWIPGCASGEEAYSMAILFTEYSRQHDVSFNLKILATDIHPGSLEIAGTGRYSAEALRGLDQKLVERYFERYGDMYQVRANIRRMVVFSTHNLIKDPPFTRMDLVSCRNLLIYFKDIAQKKVLAMFHFSLVKDGFMLLGPSESTGELADEFKTIDQRWRLFQKLRDIRLAESTQLLSLPTSSTVRDKINENAVFEEGLHFTAARTGRSFTRRILDAAYDALLSKYAPNCLLVEPTGKILHVFGDAKKFLTVGDGLFSQNVTDLIHKDLKLAISAGLDRAQDKHISEFSRSVALHHGSKADTIASLTFIPLENFDGNVDFLVISIDERVLEPVNPDVSRVLSSDHDGTSDSFLYDRLHELERDLKDTEESLQSTIEELETSNEELQATNEELMASNEELQSTNEELHSVNEELYTVSAEHQRKIEELTELTHDMDNLLRGTNIGTIFLDSEKCIRRFTPAAADTFNLLLSDIGRPITHITYRFDYENLGRDIEIVLNSKDAVEQEINVDGAAYLLRILPYLLDPEQAAGVVLTVIDIEELKNAQTQIVKERQRFEAVIKDQAELIRRYRPDGVLTFVNEAYCRFLGESEPDLLGSNWIEARPEPERQLRKNYLDGISVGEVTVTDSLFNNDGGELKWIQWTDRAIADDAGQIVEVQSVGRDITEAKIAQNQLLEQKRLFEVVVQEQSEFVCRFDPGTVITFVNDALCRHYNKSQEELVGSLFMDLIPADEREAFQNAMDLAERDLDGMHEYRDPIEASSGMWVHWSISPHYGPHGQIMEFQSVGRDVTRSRIQRDALARLHTITSDLDLDGPGKIRELLTFGSEHFGLPYAMLIEVLEQGYRIVETGGRGSAANPGDVFDLAAAYRVHEMHPDRPILIDDAAREDPEFRDMVQYVDAASIKVYFGSPIRVNGEAFGVLCFVGTSQVARKLDADDLEIVQLFAHWIGVQLATDLTLEALEEEVVLRTRAETLLERQVSRLEESNLELEQFAYVASHDLQEPLRQIESASSFLLADYKNKLPADGRELLEISADGAHRMRTLINDLLSFSQVGQAKLERLETNVADALRDGIALLGDQIADTGADIQFSDMPTLPIEPVFIRQLFQNLLSNAIKYSGSESPQITINSREEQDCWEFSVADKGIGVDPEFAERIFEIFQRLHISSEYSGTGIGLALCRRIVERHGGRIWLDREFRPGSRFCFTLQKVASHEPQEDERLRSTG